MNIRRLLIVTVLSAWQICAVAQREDSSVPRTINLQQAVELALEHNHEVRISSLRVEEDEHARGVARSSYFPVLNNHSTFAHSTDTEFIGIPAGSFGTVGGSILPQHTVVLNQGALNFALSDTGLDQPLMELFKIKSANEVARAELEASKGKTRSVEDQVALKVRQLYYNILIVQSEQQAIETKIRAAEDLQAERVQQVKYGSTLEADLIESRAQSLEAKEDLLTAQLQLSDLRAQFNYVVGLPLTSDVTIDPNVPAPAAASSREECVRLALDSIQTLQRQKRSWTKQMRRSERRNANMYPTSTLLPTTPMRITYRFLPATMEHLGFTSAMTFLMAERSEPRCKNAARRWPRRKKIWRGYGMKLKSKWGPLTTGSSRQNK
jgi:outer membrane protein TolC